MPIVGLPKPINDSALAKEIQGMTSSQNALGREMVQHLYRTGETT